MRIPATILVAALALTLSACSPPVDGEYPPSMPPAPRPTGSSTPTPSETVIDLPTLTDVTKLASCRELLNSATVNDFESQGYVLIEDEKYRQRVSQDKASVMGQFVNRDGLACLWGPPNGEATLMYGYSAITQADGDAKQIELRDKGFTIGFVDREPNGYVIYENADSSEKYAFGNGYWMYTFDPVDAGALTQIADNAPTF